MSKKPHRDDLILPCPHCDRGPAAWTALVAEVQVLLAEKRTAMSLMRTGIAVLALPLSALSVLTALSRFISPERAAPWLWALGVFCLGLLLLGAYLVLRAMRQLHRHERMIQEMKRRHSELRDML